MKKTALVKALALAVLMAATTSALAQDTVAKDEAPGDDLNFFLDIYGWMPNFYLESASGIEAEIDLGTILDNLQFVVMANPGVKKGKWTFQTDVLYFDLQADNNKTVLRQRQNDLANVQTDIEMKAWVVTPMVSYDVLEKDQFKLSLLAGARYFYMDVDLQVDINGLRDPAVSRSGSHSGDVWDGIVGIKGQAVLNEKWYLPYYFDIGTGDSNSTYQAFGGVGYRFSRVDLVAGWRYLRWNFDEGSTFDNMYINGPIAGVKIRF